MYYILILYYFWNVVHSWKIDHVSRWLQQLSPSMSDLYGACFSQHSITG